MRATFHVLAIAVLCFTSACDLPFFGEAPECERNSDCDDDEDCDDGECVREDDDDDDDFAAEGEGEGEAASADAPKFLQLSANSTTVTDTTTVVITAVLTDPDGIDDLIGGSLVNPTNDASYGSFQTSAAEGSYQLTLSFDAMNTVETVDFASTLVRNFRARFFDVDGHVAEKDIALTLTCNGEPACDGQCGGARCGSGECTFQTAGFDSAGFGICGNACRDLTSEASCGNCEISCAEECVAFNTSGGAVAGCGCAAAACANGSACVEHAFTNSQQTVCLAIDTAIVIQRPRLITAIGSAPICDIDSTTAHLFCVNEGKSTGIPGTSSSASNSTVNFVADCTGAVALDDCSFDMRDTCFTNSVECFGDNYACVDGVAGVGDTSADIAGGQAQSPYKFVPATAGTYRFEVLNVTPANTGTINVDTGDCDRRVHLDGVFMPQTVIETLTAGQPILVSVGFGQGPTAHTFTLRITKL